MELVSYCLVRKGHGKPVRVVQLDDEEELLQTHQHSKPRCSADNEALVQRCVRAMQRFITKVTKACGQ